MRQERCEEGFSPRARQTDRIEQPLARWGDAWCGVAGTRLGRDRLGDEAGQARVGLAEDAVGLLGVPRARTVQKWLGELEAADGDAHASSL